MYPNTILLGSIYWNSNNNQYYYVKDGTLLTKTNNLSYKLDPVKQQEPSFKRNKELEELDKKAHLQYCDGLFLIRSP